jgi:hypothetical protein
MKIIGFVGYSAMKFDESKAKEIIHTIFESFNDDEDYVIVSGATNMGIPKLVYEEAENYDMYLMGVMCKDGYTCELYPCDNILAVGNNWGDESEIFIDLIDELYKIGGGPQSEKETEMALKKGIPVYDYKLEPK